MSPVLAEIGSLLLFDADVFAHCSDTFMLGHITLLYI